MDELVVTILEFTNSADKINITLTFLNIILIFRTIHCYKCTTHFSKQN